MNELDQAELDLRRARDNFEALRQKQQTQQPAAEGSMQMQPNPDHVQCDLDKITTVEDCVAILKNMQTRIMFDRNNPAFADVEHLVVDDEPEAAEPQES